VQQELEDLAKVVELNNRKNEVQDAERFDGAAKSPTDETTHWRSFQGLITGVQSGFSLKLKYQMPIVGSRVEGLVHVSSLKDDWYEYRARQQALFGRKTAPPTGWVIAYFRLKCRLLRQQIDLVTINERQTNREDTQVKSID